MMDMREIGLTLLGFFQNEPIGEDMNLETNGIQGSFDRCHEGVLTLKLPEADHAQLIVRIDGSIVAVNGLSKGLIPCMPSEGDRIALENLVESLMDLATQDCTDC